MRKMEKDIEKRMKKHAKEMEKLRKKSNKIPTEAILMDSTDKVWNFIPLGVTIRKNKEVPVGWYLNDQNYVEGAYDTLPSTSILIAGGTGSGKSVVEANIIAHINEFKSNFQLIGADCKRIEFNAIRNKFDGVLETPKDTADAVSVVHKVMMERFKLLEKYKANSIYALISNTIKVPYYTIKGLGKYQFDTIFTGVHTTKKSRTSNGVTMTIEDIYNGLTEGLFDRARFESIVITSENIEKVEGFYMPKDIVFMVDEMSNLMLIDDDYKTVDTIKNTMGSIARLGRAVGIHLVLCCQRASGSVIWSDLKNNCQMNILLGGFDKDASILTLNEDLSDYCRPDIRGRGFIGSGNDIIETQIYSGRITRF
jgi:DNA segregation ATPase FtsK/SpoIIIE-like protein